jgi:enamine deaminase RidA (YjgF/YER057c/UK114 family)
MPQPQQHDAADGLQVLTSGSLSLLSSVIDDAAAMNAETLRTAVAEAYALLDSTLSGLRLSPIRFWNYLPNPAQPMQPGVDRYMVFNAGRFDGYGRHRTPASGGGGVALPTASAVGFAGSDLIVHCLASDRAGIPVENPRQTSSWCYSARYGPLPPCFSRATIATLRGRPQLLIGGTASIVGEDSCHAGDIEAQLSETLLNIAAVVTAARGRGEPRLSALAALTDVRAYVVRQDHATAVRDVIERVCGDARVELTLSRICRPELLVEIEGVAAFSPQE